MTKEEDLRFETYINDTVMWGKELQKSKRFTHMALIGHSEGSLIGASACQKMNASAFVSIAGAGILASQLLLTQLQPMLPEDLFDDAKVLLKSNKLAKQITIDGMNHVLKKVSGNLQEQISSYGDPRLPIAEELVEAITAFLVSIETMRPNN